MNSLDRRTWLATTAATTAAAVTGQLLTPAATHAQADDKAPFGFSLNTSTIRGQKLGIVEEIKLAAKAGYDGIEPWLGNINQYTEGGGSLKDLRKLIDDSGLHVASAIGFARWIVADDQERKKGLETAKRDMETIRALGGGQIAAPPVGGTREAMDLDVVAERYRALCEVGAAVEVRPQLELWGFSQTLHKLGELVYVATEAAHPSACLLPDVYHIYKGGSDFHGLKMINGKQMLAFHMNDYPADPPRDKIGDADRVYPGDGVAPLDQILGDLYSGGFRGMLSLELFNRTYWQQDPLEVAKTGLAKMKAAVAKAMAGNAR